MQITTALPVNSKNSDMENTDSTSLMWLEKKLFKSGNFKLAYEVNIVGNNGKTCRNFRCS